MSSRQPGPEPATTQYQTENPQETTRAEAVEAAHRPAHADQGEPRRLSWGESRFLRHAVQAIDTLLRAQIGTRAALTTTLSTAHSALVAELYLVHAESVGEFGLVKETYHRHVRQHTVDDVDTTEDEESDGPGTQDARRSARRPWMPSALRWTVVAALVAADLFFFLSLWRDVEDANDDYWSVKTLQALLYAVITPIATAVVAVVLGRVVAAHIHRGAARDRAHGVRAWLVGVPAGMLVLAVLFGVTQRLAYLSAEQGAAHVSHVLVYLIFLVLPLVLFLTEVVVNDEEHVVHTLRTGDWTKQQGALRGVSEAVMGRHAAAVAAHTALGAHLSSLKLRIREPLNASADILAQEWGRGGAHDDWATTLPQTIAGHLPDAAVADPAAAPVVVPCGAWPELEEILTSLPSLYTGDTLILDLSELTKIQEALIAFQPPAAEVVLASVLAAWGAGDVDLDERHRVILDGPASPTRRPAPATPPSVSAPPLHSVIEESA